MPDDTTILSLPLILPAQAQKHVTHNEALAALDLIVQLAVINRTLTTPPGQPATGDRHIVAAGAVGAWAGQSGTIALYSGTGWQFTEPLPGWRAHVLAEGQTAVFDGVAWKSPSDGPLTVTRLGVAATADAVNRLSVASPAALFNHAGSGHQLKINKATAADTASLLFQTGFSGRAEMGTAGTDAFGLKVSANGSLWSTALEAAPATGEVTFPAPVKLGGQATDPASPVNGSLWLNSTTGEVRVRSAGQTFPLGGGGALGDGDKGDITVSGGGSVWTVESGAITLSKLAGIPTGSFLGRDSAGTGAPEVVLPAQARVLLNVSDGATANAADAVLLDRANHTGTQLAGTISNFGATVRSIVLTGLTVAGTRTAIAATDTILDAFGKAQKWLNDLSAVAFSGSASDLGSGTLPPARMPAQTGDVTVPAGSTVQTLATVNANVGAFGLAGSVAQFTVNAKGLVTAAANVAISVAATAISDSTAAGRSMLTAASAAAQTALLSVFSPSGPGSAKGLVPDPGTTAGTTRYLREDGTWAAPAGGGGGGSPGGSAGEIQWNNAGVFAGAADVEIEGGQLRLSAIGTPATPADGGVKLFGRSVAGRLLPAIIGPAGLDTSLQPHLGRNKVSYAIPNGNGTTLGLLGLALTATGTATAKNWASTNRYTKMRGLEYLVTTAAATAIAAWRGAGQQFTVGSNAAGDGGFHLICRWGPSTGVATATSRAFVGLVASTAAPGDAEPSARTNQCGMGWDAADANIQFMHNDGTGNCTKIDLGAAFPVPTTDRTNVYEIAMFSPPGTVQGVTYEITNLNSGAVATGTVTTDLPSTTTALNPYGQMSVGGTSAVIGICLFSLYIETDY
jgi:hypothetical protein